VWARGATCLNRALVHASPVWARVNPGLGQGNTAIRINVLQTTGVGEQNGFASNTLATASCRSFNPNFTASGSNYLVSPLRKEY
ncbi:MAG: hypothetical protein KAU38_06145, partial [Desulfobacterales bacterium]|nr:hypothetical protein [Desulfobacterales bacterium]